MTAGSCRTCAVRLAERHREPWQSVAVAGEAADVIGSWWLRMAGQAGGAVADRFWSWCVRGAFWRLEAGWR